MITSRLNRAICHKIFGLVAAGTLLIAGLAVAQQVIEAGVRYRSQDTVYLDAGTAAGLAEGDFFEILRDGQRIAEVEVTFVAEYSASCRIVNESLSVQPGDRARLLTAARRTDDEEEPETAESAASVEAEASSPPPAYSPSPSTTRRAGRRTRVSGALELGWDSFKDDTEAGRDFDRVAARLGLRVRDIGGLPLHLRVRMRLEEDQRSRAYSDGAPESERRDRFYEAALLYDPERGRFKAQIGRIAVSPFISVGYLDGLIGQVRIIEGIDVGALFGSQPIFQSDSFFETRGQKYGAYTRFSAFRQSGQPDLEVFVAGIREEGDVDVSREYVAVETRYTPGGRWSLYQRAEVDLNNGWREEFADSKTQLSNLGLTLNTSFSRFSRFSISYDRWERYLTEESRPEVEVFFDNLLRQGLRARYSYGKPRGMGFSVYAGYRDQEGEEESTVSFGGAVRHTNVAGWGLSIGGDLLGYSNPMTEGLVARLQTSKRFSGGHEVALLVGGRFYSNKLFDDVDDRSDQWIRLSGWVELPLGFFARAELEYSDGDDLQGQRILLSLGYRL